MEKKYAKIKNIINKKFNVGKKLSQAFYKPV
jgi:hypothetical protein